MKERFTVFMIVALAVGVFAPTVQADLVLELSDGTTLVSVTDNEPDDLNPDEGVVLYSGTIGVWTVNVATGVSKPVIGAVTDPKLDLNSINVSDDAGWLGIALQDTDFSLSPSWGGAATLISEIGGTTAGTVEFAQFLDQEDSEGLAVELGPFGPGAFAGTGTDSGLLSASPFSLTELVFISHDGAGATSFNALSSVVPLPSAILLGLLGLGAAGVKLRRVC
jgi:hypothetical protein